MLNEQVRTLTFTRQIAAPPAAVYAAFTNATALREWLCETADVNAAVDRPLFLGWNSGYQGSGYFTDLQPNERIGFNWQGLGEADVSQVAIALRPADGGTEVTLNHYVGGDDEDSSVAEQVSRLWEAGLENLQSALETGLDLRIMRRPMLGIFPGQLTAEQAAKLGVPVTKGTYIGGVVDGMGAQAAGIRKDDVIVSVDGQPVHDFPSMSAAVKGHIAGDTIPVEFYRGPVKHTVQMTLAGRPKPNVPSTPADFAATVRRLHSELNAELDALVAGVSEAEADHAPAAGEWNAKQVMAHLIFTERFNQLFIWGLVGGDDSIPWPDNNPAQIAGILATHPTLADLVAEFRRAQEATAATYAALPESLLARKASYTRLAQNIGPGADQHTREHFKQMKAAIESARG